MQSAECRGKAQLTYTSLWEGGGDKCRKRQRWWENAFANEFSLDKNQPEKNKKTHIQIQFKKEKTR